MTTNSATGLQNGFRYTLPSTSAQTVVFSTRGPIGAFYDMAINGTVYIGGDFTYSASNAWMQYVRLYLNYVPNSEDEMINLATMSTGKHFILGEFISLLSCFKGILYIAHFSSLPSVNNNQTVVVDYAQETTQGTLTAYKGKRT